MLRYILKRLIQMVPLLLIVSFIAFAIIRVAEVKAGADPLAQMKMNPSTTEETLRRERRRMGYETARFIDKTIDSQTFALSDEKKTVDADSTAVTLPDGKKLKLMSAFKVDGATAADGSSQKMNVSELQNNLKPGYYGFTENTFVFHADELNQQVKIEYGTPNNFITRYSVWGWAFLKGDMGQSYFYKTKVSTLIKSRLFNTIVLGLVTLVLTWFVAIPLGIFLAVRQYSLIDQVFSSVSYFFMGFPDFFLAIILLLFAAVTGWFPIGGMTAANHADMTAMGKIVDVAHHVILPAVTLALISIASLQRRMRANLLDILGEEYIKTARAKGLNENKVIYKHAVRNAINPIITLLGFEIASLISGAAFVEIIFNWPGLGNMMLQAVIGTDLNLVMAGLVISATMLLLGNLIADLLLAFVDPRIKLEA